MFQAERFVLGALLLRADALGDIPLEPPKFHNEAHRFIACAIQTLVEARGETDVVTVADLLKEWGVLDEAGGLAGLLALQADCPASTSAPRYYAEMREEL
jgi:replicative DNA helicase